MSIEKFDLVRVKDFMEEALLDEGAVEDVKIESYLSAFQELYK